MCGKYRLAFDLFDSKEGLLIGFINDRRLNGIIGICLTGHKLMPRGVSHGIANYIGDLGDLFLR